MAAPYANSMNDAATYWAPGVPDGMGGLDFSGVAPVLVACRWQDVHVLARAVTGEEFVADAVVYPDRELTLQGLLARGDQTGATDPREAGAREIRNVQSSPSLDGAEVLWKVTL